MMPDGVLSTTPVVAQFLSPRNIPKRALVDYELGGNDLNDASAGLQTKVWTGRYVEEEVLLSAPGVAEAPVLTKAGVLEFGFTFDSNMQPFVTYELIAGGCEFYWFDPVADDFVTTALPSGSRSPRCSLDDKRALQSGIRDILLCYCRGTSLCIRRQRDRYENEIVLDAGVGASRLIQVGMSHVNRFQFHLSTVSG